AYMVPSAIVLLSSMPLTPNGKVDRKALPAPDFAAGVGAALASPTEQSLASLWQEVLGVERAGADDDFFAQGGQSLMAAQLLARVRGRFNVEVPIGSLFQRRTLRELAAEIDAAHSRGQLPGLPPLTRADRSRPLPLASSPRWT